MLRNLTVLWTLSISVLFFAVPIAHAHEVEPAVADVTLEAETIILDIEVALEALIAGIDLSEIEDTNASPLSGLYDRYRAMGPEEFGALVRAQWPALAGRLRVLAGETPVRMSPDDIFVPDVGDPELRRDSRIRLTGILPADGSPVQVGWAAVNGPLILRHANGGPDAFAGFLGPGELSPPLPREGGAAESGFQSFLRYIVIGFEHIVPKGLDHILFVLGLFFFSTRMGPLLWQVTAFTLAHTVTLALATLGIVNLPAHVVEPLIAASIVYIAVENLITDRITPWRTAIVFCFGLLHGLGFASVLGDVGLSAGQFVESLIGFNIGVEFGQLAVIAVAWITIGYWFGDKPYYRAYIARPASIFIGAVGAWWVIERTML